MVLGLDEWERTAEHLQSLPGGQSLCANIRRAIVSHTRNRWSAIGAAAALCTHFPADEFRQLHSVGDFDVRWVITFAAWFWGASGASVDSKCRAFLKETGLLDAARFALREYGAPDWVSAWRTAFAEFDA